MIYYTCAYNINHWLVFHQWLRLLYSLKWIAHFGGDRPEMNSMKHGFVDPEPENEELIDWLIILYALVKGLTDRWWFPTSWSQNWLMTSPLLIT